MIRRFLPLVLTSFSFVIAYCGGTFAGAVTLLDVGGSADTGQTITTNEAVAVSFTLGAAFADVEISAQVTCVNCTGSIYFLKNQIGPGTPVTDLIDADTYDLTSTNPIFQGLSLDPATYFVVLDVDSGTAIWEGSTSPVIVNHPQVNREADFAASSTPNPGYLADFGVLLNQGALHYTVESIPEPSGVLLALAGAMGLMMVRRRR